VWTTVLALAAALNFEPIRIGLITVLLSRPRPLLQLSAYLAGSLAISFGCGLLVLFVFHRNPLGTSASSGARTQIAVGVIALALAAVVALRTLAARRGRRGPAGAGSRAVDALTASAGRLLRRGESPWFSAVVGVGSGLPSVDYLALLVIIATSQAAPAQKVGALVAFLLIGNLVVLIPIVGYLVAPERTGDLVNRLGSWTRSRSGMEYAALLAFVGVLLIGLGWRGL